MATRHRHSADQKAEHWLNDKWRPMMGWMYMAICTFDFMVAPILWSLLQAKDHGVVNSQWQPLTLQGAGLFHLAMGAVLGISAYGRTQEKLNGSIPMSFPQGSGTTYIPPGGQPMYNQQPQGFGGNNSFGQQPQGFGGNNSFGQQPQGFGGNNSFGQQPITPMPAAPVLAGFAGKKAPIIPTDPEI